LLLRHELLRGLLRRLSHVLLTKRRKRLSACRRAEKLSRKLAKARVCGLAKVLLAKAKQTLSRLAQRRELLLRLRGLV
jgi:hypothetical protein